jgi:hypothetical protein
MNNYRHGDLCLVGVKSVPKSAKIANTKTLMTGSGGHAHTFDNGKHYVLEGDDFIIGYLRAKDTKLYHIEHGKDVGKSFKEAKITDGVYELRRQVEYTNEGMRQVED